MQEPIQEPMQEPMQEPFHIPGYTFVSKIAEGGMATVWKARQEKLDRVVAIKVLMKDMDASPDVFQRFIYEARAAASLIHPNVVQVIDAGERDHFMYYIMEYVPGTTAGDVVENGRPMKEAQLLRIAREVAEALDYAWREHHVVHCDIKPENLLLHRNGRTKVADLGLAQVTGMAAVEIEEGMTLGTPNYFPPEQALVEEELDCRADMYALGATLYHLGTGVVPFGEDDPETVAAHQVHSQLQHPRELNSHLSWGMACLIERLMAKKANDRYTDWSEVLEDLHLVEEGRMILYPLSASVKSTVTHVEPPVMAATASRPAVRKIPVQRQKAALKISVQHAEALHARRPMLETPSNIWPKVLGLGFLVVLMYSYTVFRMQGAF